MEEEITPGPSERNGFFAVRQRSTRQDRKPGKGQEAGRPFYYRDAGHRPESMVERLWGRLALDATWRRATPLRQGPGSSESARGVG